jgi:hypothetical protein
MRCGLALLPPLLLGRRRYDAPYDIDKINAWVTNR